MVLLEKTKSYFFSSATSNGATNKTSDNNTFSIQLNQGIGLPRETVYSECSITSATVWNVADNIASLYSNNKLSFFSKHVFTVVGETVNIVFPDGLYGITELQDYLSRQFVINGYPANLFVFSEEVSTQKTILTLNSANELYIDFTIADSIRELVGFDSRFAPTLPKYLGYSESSDNEAKFNRVNSFLIKSDLISNGIPTNGLSEGLLANIPITSSPGSVINYTPINPSIASAVELIGYSRTFITFRLLDEQSRSVIMPEDWAFELRIKYWIHYNDDSKYDRSFSRH